MTCKPNGDTRHEERETKKKKNTIQARQGFASKVIVACLSQVY